MRKTTLDILKLLSIHSILVYFYSGEVVWGRLYILLLGFLLAWFLSGKKNWPMNMGFAITLLLCISNSVTTTFWGLPFSINFLASASGKATILSEFVSRLPYLQFLKIFLTFAALSLFFFLLQSALEKNASRKCTWQRRSGSDFPFRP